MSHWKKSKQCVQLTHKKDYKQCPRESFKMLAWQGIPE